jgi:hypothetical protein
MQDASQVLLPLVSQSRREKLPRKGDKKVTSLSIRVPVVSSNGIPLMPCEPARARELVKSDRAIRRFKTGIFYIKLVERETGDVQKVTCGIDPGSKREGFTVKSANHTYINVLSNAVDTVKDKIKTRMMMRRNRRQRKTPYRKNKCNRKHGGLPPSTRARWQAKLRIINILKTLYPISVYIVEDIKVRTIPGKTNWNKSFSSLETGKNLFYFELRKIGSVILKQGYETKEYRDKLGLIKTKAKLENVFSAHNVDSWVLANLEFDQKVPDNTNIFRMIPLNFHRRQLYYLQTEKNEIKRPFGGTISHGITKGTVIKHNKYGYVYIGGKYKDRVSGHDLSTGARVYANIKPLEVDILYMIKWRFLISLNS